MSTDRVEPEANFALKADFLIQARVAASDPVCARHTWRASLHQDIAAIAGEAAARTSTV